MVDYQWAVLAQASGGKPLSYWEMLVWPGGGYIGAIIWLLSVGRGNVMPDLVREQIQGMFDNKQYREAIEVTAAEPSMLSYIVHAGLGEAAHGYLAMEQAMAESGLDVAFRTTRSLNDALSKTPPEMIIT